MQDSLIEGLNQCANFSLKITFLEFLYKMVLRILTQYRRCLPSIVQLKGSKKIVFWLDISGGRCVVEVGWYGLLRTIEKVLYNFLRIIFRSASISNFWWFDRDFIRKRLDACCIKIRNRAVTIDAKTREKKLQKGSSSSSDCLFKSIDRWYANTILIEFLLLNYSFPSKKLRPYPVKCKTLLIPCEQSK